MRLDLPCAEAIRASLPAVNRVGSAASAAKALSDPTRLMIATALSNGDELCVCDMAWVVGAAQNLVSHHLRQMKKVAVVTARRDGKLVMYRLTPLGIHLTAAVLASIGVEESTAGTEVKSLPLTAASTLPMPADNGCDAAQPGTYPPRPSPMSAGCESRNIAAEPFSG
ncbi:metalloregulator ArsR/SmtB family transcription factor [Mycolicibacterium sp. D5.8-2]|uniref:ArsR/SmtB family transcription factor n=1 Tax=Mycolicibacterium sp. D5.8-2 TaxID=3085903 RepID=UPI00298CA6D8|nr:metalloregulator ArsR/SmtB family transcription factor [Mycolicibacterium sp. D5.8-2]MDW5615134.1 metalloregulator ArsR/SmtB family transcription factor [Mycolicibacterium sp. D5.8-2]